MPLSTHYLLTGTFAQNHDLESSAAMIAADLSTMQAHSGTGTDPPPRLLTMNQVRSLLAKLTA